MNDLSPSISRVTRPDAEGRTSEKADDNAIRLPDVVTHAPLDIKADVIL